MNQVVSPAIALLQQLETLLRDPVLGPRVARQVAIAIESVAKDQRGDEGKDEHERDDTSRRLDADAYARLWIPAWDANSPEQRALISLASI
jgi:hypothetical protein